MNSFKRTHNVLVMSISQKIPLIKCVKAAMCRIDPQMKLYGADIDNSVIGRHFVDAFWEMPRINNINAKEIISFCQHHGIKYIIPTRDGELEYFSSNRDILKQFGIYVMVSPRDAIEICLDKLNFYNSLKGLRYPVISTYLTLEGKEQALKYIVKERFGAGAKSLGINLSIEEASKHAKKLSAPIIQPMINGTEYSVDLFVDKNGRSKGIISRTRNKVVNGESQITSTKSMAKLEKLCSEVAESLHLYGHVIFQVIVDKDMNYHIIECNPRFGGASTLSVAAGLDSFYWFFLEAMGESLDNYPFERSKEELTLVRHPQDYIF